MRGIHIPDYQHFRDNRLRILAQPIINNSLEIRYLSATVTSCPVSRGLRIVRIYQSFLINFVGYDD